ncbi:MAG: 23S rRNA (adenine(2503)-C(2))-methyltransferase RlmN [Deltaproteobacteria bacterium]|nr:23S rRNA (adenine(2503)-C(2))-methyltransferase RlmN [Deltaproteobacteria bacterium]
MIQRHILELGGRALFAEAQRLIPRGFGVARRIYREACLEGRFQPETTGIRPDAVEAWRSAFRFSLPRVVRSVAESSDFGGDTIKTVLATDEGLEFEMVRVPMGAGKYTLCVSSQVGCRLACGFCETGRMGLLRNLSTAEIVGQVVLARGLLGWPIRNIVFMGMGEPLDNADNVIGALRVLNDPFGLSYGQQRLTICTVGHPDGLAKLATLGWKRLDVSISLNGATDEVRDRVMPINRKVGIRALRDALERFPRRAKFVYGINYCLMPGINDRYEDAEAVASFCRSLRVMVNVIPYNPGTRPLARAPTEHEVVQFMDWLSALEIPVTRRVTKGRSVMAGCGQLGNVELRRTRLPIRDQAGSAGLADPATPGQESDRA